MIWTVAFWIFAAGCVGGLVNALLVDKGFKAPSTRLLENEERIWQPGWLGNLVVGGFTSLVTWGLYGPLTKYPLLTSSTATPPEIVVAVGELTTALLIGVGGSRVLTSEVQKKLLEASKEELRRDLGNQLDKLQDTLGSLTTPNDTGKDDQ